MSREKRGKLLDMERLDALMRSVYGRTLYQFVADQIQRAWQDGYEQGSKVGYKLGIKGGRRLAKGKSEFPKKKDLFSNSHGRPPVLAPILLEQFIEFVNRWKREEGISLPAAVSKYRDVVVRSWKDVGGPEPSQEQLLRLYKRATKLKRR